MPQFLEALKNLEAARTEARETFGKTIEAAADLAIRRNRQATFRSISGSFAIILLLLALALWLRLRIIAPIVCISELLRVFRSEGLRRDVPGLARQDEIGDLARGVSEYHDAVEVRRATQRKVDFLAHHDTLTGLANRLLFENRLAHELNRARRSGDKVAVFAIDMDDFKSINDRLGHAGGDDALRRAAKLLSRCARATDLVARIGGDEFAIIQAAGNQPAAAEALLSRITSAISDTADAEVPIRMSLGVAISDGEQDGEDLHNSADLALYRAKADGRNTSRFFDTDLQEEVGLRRRLSRDLERAIAANQLHLVYQPITTITKDVRGFEALLRWSHPELGEIPPDTFILLAERTGQIGRIGMWAAEHAIAAAAAWPTHLTLSLNLSPLQFRNPDLAEALLAVADLHGVASSRLEFEVTESATLLGQHRHAVLTILRRLQASGALISLDDFGTGHSSLSNLKEFSFDKLKIDRSFVATMLSHPPSATIVKATIGLGRSLGMTIVAEGVETDLQLSQLRDWGCDQVQGFGIGRPAREAELLTRMRSKSDKTMLELSLTREDP
ncbi:MAG: EAL domain-containing protein [Oxalobacteraceae bacterium]|nr:MAG: EAL domain-containing protein [Oxalobacteraceae bacterium]